MQSVVDEVVIGYSEILGIGRVQPNERVVKDGVIEDVILGGIEKGGFGTVKVYPDFIICDVIARNNISNWIEPGAISQVNTVLCVHVYRIIGYHVSICEGVQCDAGQVIVTAHVLCYTIVQAGGQVNAHRVIIADIPVYQVPLTWSDYIIKLDARILVGGYSVMRAVIVRDIIQRG